MATEPNLPTRKMPVAALLPALESGAMDDERYLVKRDAIEADLELVPDELTGEIIDGNLYAFPRPASLHSRGVTRLARQLGPADEDDGPDGWIILFEPAVWFTRRKRHMLVPDVAGWRRARMPELPDTKSFKLAPDWVCEGMSPSTARYDRGRKREIYAAAGVGHLWFVDPVNHTVEACVLVDGSYQIKKTAGDAQVVRLPPFDFDLNLAKLWQR